MKVIAITGGIASGKSTVANILAEKYNIPVIDSDHIAKDIVKPNSILLNKIISKFGSNILNSDNTLNRKKLRALIFNNVDNKKWLEELLHPEINKQIRNQINQLKQTAKFSYCLVLIPLVTKEYLANNKFIDKVLVIQSSNNNKIKRAQTRDSQSKQQIDAIINSQIPDKERNQLADYIITNDSSIADLEKKVSEFYLSLI